jgi:hypothetical protein
MTRPKSDFENQTRLPKTDVVVTAIVSLAWASAVSRVLVEGNSSRRLEACLAVDDLRVALAVAKRHVAIIEVNDDNFKSCCELGQVNTSAASPALLIGLIDGVGGDIRHALRTSGFGMTCESFADLSRLTRVVDKFFASLSPINLSIEASAELALPWSR